MGETIVKTENSSENWNAYRFTRINEHFAPQNSFSESPRLDQKPFVVTMMVFQMTSIISTLFMNGLWVFFWIRSNY